MDQSLFYIENFICLFTKTNKLIEKDNCTEPSHIISDPWFKDMFGVAMNNNLAYSSNELR